MKIRMLTLAAGEDGIWPAGSVQVVDDDVAKQLIAGGYAKPCAEGEELELATGPSAARETATAPAQKQRRTKTES